MRRPITSGGETEQAAGNAGSAATEALNQARASVEALHWLRAGEPAVAAFAPARLDVLGGIADYSGATVLELPLANGVVAIAQRTADRMLSVMTTGPMAPAVRPVSLPLAVLLDGTLREAPERLRSALRTMDTGWAAYILGPVAMLVAQDLLRASLARESGLRIGVWSNVPAGAGISSSAALEVATLRALQGLCTPDLDEMAGMQLATLAQAAEHRVALAPCGIMDQATSTLGMHEHLLVLRCQPCEILGQRPLPPGARILGIDSGVAHRVAAGQYGRVRAAAFMGRRLITELAEVDGCQEPTGGYLCNLTTDRFEEAYASRLPAEMRGADFLARHRTHDDAATTVEPEQVYRVRDCTAHPIYEAANVTAFLAALDAFEMTGERAALIPAGEAMYRSHASYSERCSLGAPETDLVVELAREAGPEQGVYGAHMTGGGAGGTVAVLVAGAAGVAAVHTIAAEYAQRTGQRSAVLAGSADGALRVSPERFTPGRAASRKEERDD